MNIIRVHALVANFGPTLNSENKKSFTLRYVILLSSMFAEAASQNLFQYFACPPPEGKTLE